jgi:diguanylate cyclase (GGDEF)-like protein
MVNLRSRKICQARLEALLRAISGRKLIEALASIDFVTELPNRREYERRLEEEWLRARRMKQPVSLVLADIDFFKDYNDAYGHALGDDCLRQVAVALARSVQRSSDFVGRYGGEEFVTLLPDTHREGALQVAEGMRQAVARLLLAHRASKIADHVTVSFGVAVSTHEDGHPSSLVRAADQALYLAKEAGRNRVEFLASMRPPAASL